MSPWCCTESREKSGLRDMRTHRFVLLVMFILTCVGSGHALAANSTRTSAVANTDFGHWSTPFNVSQSPTDDAIWPALEVSADGEVVYLAWSDGRDGNKNIYYASSTDGGDSWQAADRIWDSNDDSLRPDVAMSGTVPLLIWADEKVALSHDTYEMALGDASPSLLPNERTVLAYASRLALSNGVTHAVLQGGENQKPDILYSRRVGSSPWPTATVVFTHTAIGSYNPAIAVGEDGQVVHLVWQENQTGGSTIRYLRGERKGEQMTWSSAITLSQEVTTSVRPDIALATDGTLHVVWGEKLPDRETQYVRYVRSTDGGNTWSTPLRIFDAPVSANSLAPTDIAPVVVALPSGAVCAAWHGFPKGADYDAEDIYVSCSDDGTSWGTPVNVSQSRDAISIRPTIAAGSDGILHLAWQEYVGPSATENYEIYYAHSIPFVVYLPAVLKAAQ